VLQDNVNKLLQGSILRPPLLLACSYQLRLHHSSCKRAADIELLHVKLQVNVRCRDGMLMQAGVVVVVLLLLQVLVLLQRCLWQQRQLPDIRTALPAVC